MTFFELDYLDYERTHREGYAEFDVDPKRPYVLGKEFPRCSFCGAKLGPLPWLPPHCVVFSAGTFGDLCTDGGSLLFTQRFRDRFAEARLSGLEWFDQAVDGRPKIQRGSAREIPKYFVAEPKFVLTRLNERESGLVARERDGCDHCGTATRESVARLRVDEATWNGDDVFAPSGLYGAVLVTERFVEFVRKHSFTNFHFTHQDDYREPKFGPQK